MDWLPKNEGKAVMQYPETIPFRTDGYLYGLTGTCSNYPHPAAIVKGFPQGAPLEI